MPPEELGHLDGIAEEVVYPEGEVVIREGDHGEEMFLIVEGEIEIHRESESLAVLKRQDYFGEMSILDDEPRSATATARADCLLLRIRQSDFYDILERHFNGMLWEIILKSEFARNIDVGRIITFEDFPAAPDSSGFKTRFLNQLLDARATGGNTLVLSYDASTRGTAEHPFVPPKTRISYENLADSDAYVSRLMTGNRPLPDGTPKAWAVLLSEIKPSGVRGATGIEVLQGVLVLKRILALNKTLPLTIREFRVGRQIIFPTEQDLKQRFHIIDRDAARFFYEVIQYYPEFEQSFNRETRRITQILKKGS